MIEGLLCLPVLVPVLFWAAYHYHKDRHLPEPPLNLVVAFFLGIGASFVSAAMYRSLDLVGLRFDAVELGHTDPVGLFAYSMLAIGPIEEFAKLAPFVLVVIHWKAFDERIDGLIYASFIALGYAAAENVHYLQFLTPLEAVARGFAGPVIHMLFASIWGYRIAAACADRRPLWRAALAGFLIAAALHGIYDFIVLLEPVSALPIAAALIAAVWIWRLRLLRSLHLEATRSDALTADEDPAQSRT